MRRACVAAVLLVATACSQAVPPTNPAAGFLTKVDPPHISIRTSAGGSYTFRVADPTADFDDLILTKEREGAVLVRFEEQNGELIAVNVDRIPT